MVEIDYCGIGGRIKSKRILCKLTQEKLAEMVDISPSFMGEIERGTSIPSLATVANIAGSLELDLDYLILGTTINNANNYYSNLLDSIPAKNRNLFVSLCEDVASTLKHF